MDLVELHNDRVSRAPPGVILPPTEHWYMVDAMSACAVLHSLRSQSDFPWTRLEPLVDFGFCVKQQAPWCFVCHPLFTCMRETDRTASRCVERVARDTPGDICSVAEAFPSGSSAGFNAADTWIPLPLRAERMTT